MLAETSLLGIVGRTEFGHHGALVLKWSDGLPSVRGLWEPSPPGTRLASHPGAESLSRSSSHLIAESQNFKDKVTVQRHDAVLWRLFNSLQSA